MYHHRVASLESHRGMVLCRMKKQIPFIKLCPSRGNSNIEITAPLSFFGDLLLAITKRSLMFAVV
jgi:hypothetical protein